MFAVVEIAGQQYKVTIADKIFVPKIEQKVGSKLKFDKVLVLVDETQTIHRNRNHKSLVVTSFKRFSWRREYGS
jgi:ribosomal protein L21